MEIAVLRNGLFESNTWVVGEHGCCTVIDCGAPAADILETVRRMGCRVTHIVLTHGHLDHVCQAEALVETTGASLCLHEWEKGLYSDPEASGFSLFGIPRSRTFPMPDRLLRDGELLETGGPSFRILHTPGHTAGCICLLADGHLFSGDTLFWRGVGRTDLPTGDAGMLVRSLRDTLYRLAPETVVHPGHGPDTTIGQERTQNPHVTAD